ncbi:hypothetical protein A2U01_0056381, partial [Trifolium medium]|nr:hypothetical protein [Trifolium medium]
FDLARLVSLLSGFRFGSSDTTTVTVVVVGLL